MSLAVMHLTGDFLRQLLHFPFDCEISGKGGSGMPVTVVVEHPSIPADAIEVKPIMMMIHGVAVFDRFEVTARGGN